MKQVAFFDLDNTMVRGSSLFYFARQLMAEGLLRRRTVACFAILEARFVLRRRESAEDRDRVAANALAMVRGHSAMEINALCTRIAERLMGERLVPATLQALRKHQAQGAETWLVTASPIELADAIAAGLGMTGAIATRPDIVDGRYSGTLNHGIMHGPRKAAAIVGLALDRGLDLAGAFAYSDSENDVPMLSLTGHAGVVNANRRLRRIARARGWSILPACSFGCALAAEDAPVVTAEEAADVETAAALAAMVLQRL
ncbi:MAG: HAD family hydrolase [Candidatus Nanopelagicales bacterium]